MPIETILPVQHLRHYASVYPAAWEQARACREQWRKMPDYRDWCYLPLSAAYAIINAEADKQGVSMLDACIDVGNLGALIAWRMTQGIYRFDSTIYESLWNTPLEGDLPIDVLYRLPEWGVWIETPNDPILQSPGFFAYLEYELHTGRSELRLAISDGQRLAGQIIHLTQSSLLDCIEDAYQAGIRQAEKAGLGRDPEAIALGSKFAQALKVILAPRISLLLYLCTVNSEIADRKTGQRTPSKPKPVKDKKGTRLLAASTPTAWDVAMRLGAAIRSVEAKERSEPQGGTHASPRGHWRRAHWHTFTRGAGRTERFVKWLPTLPINVKDEDLPAVLREVKE
jgi:hypothetical protein